MGIEQFSIAPVSQECDIPKKPGRNTLAGGRASRSVRTPAERRAIAGAIGRRTIREVHARRGVTLWHKAAIALEQIDAEAPGAWATSGEVWSRIPQATGVSISKVNSALQRMAKCGRAERAEIPGRGKPGRMAPGRNGGVFWIRAPRWAYRLTDAGRASAEEGRGRIAEGRPSEALRPGRSGRPRKPRAPWGSKSGRRLAARLAQEVDQEGPKAQEGHDDRSGAPQGGQEGQPKRRGDRKEDQD